MTIPPYWPLSLPLRHIKSSCKNIITGINNDIHLIRNLLILANLINHISYFLWLVLFCKYMCIRNMMRFLFVFVYNRVFDKSKDRITIIDKNKWIFEPNYICVFFSSRFIFVCPNLFIFLKNWCGRIVYMHAVSMQSCCYFKSLQIYSYLRL